MDKLKPEDELEHNFIDLRISCYRQFPFSERNNKSQINFDEARLDVNNHYYSRIQDMRNKQKEDYDSEIDLLDKIPIERSWHKRKKATEKEPAPRQYVMTALGVFVLLLLIVGIGSALNTMTGNLEKQTVFSKNSIILFDSKAANQVKDAKTMLSTTSVDQTTIYTTPHDISLPSSLKMYQNQNVLPVQQRVKMQNDLNNILTKPQNEKQVNSTMANSTTFAKPGTIASVCSGDGDLQLQKVEDKTKLDDITNQSTPYMKHKQAVTRFNDETKLKTTTKTTITGKFSGNVNALKLVPSSNYTLQLSSSSNYDNLNRWAKKLNLKNYVVYQTSYNGQPWYVLINGVYDSKGEAERAVHTLPVDVQMKKPWVKPIYQVQIDLK